MQKKKKKKKEAEKSHLLGSWNQFAGNRHLISAPSTYDESLYTTEIPRNIPAEWLRLAEKKSDDRETPDTGHHLAENEEIQHCAVQRKGTTANLAASISTLKSGPAINAALKDAISRQQRNADGIKGVSKTDNRSPRRPLETRRQHQQTIKDSTLGEQTPTRSQPAHQIQSPPKHSSGTKPMTSETGCSESQSDGRREDFGNRYAPRNGSDKPPPLPQSAPKHRICPAEGCAWRTIAHGGSWQAYYNHVAYHHSTGVPAAWWAAEGKFLCETCGKHYTLNRKTTHPKTCIGQSSQAAQMSVDIFSQHSIVTETAELPTLASVCTLAKSTCKDVPHRCRQLWAEILTSALKAAVQENSVATWTLLAMLPKCVLPAPRRGGRKGYMAYSSHVRKCMERWMAKEYTQLWKEAAANRRQRNPDPISEQHEAQKAVIRAELLVRQGEFSRGMAALTAAPMADENEETYAKLLEKHPARQTTTEALADLPPHVKHLNLEESDIKVAINSFRRGSSAGTMGLRPEHLQSALLSYEDKNVHPLQELTNLANHLLSGKAPIEVQAYFAGARLCALKKGENDVRPIAAGETIRRLVSKAACSSVRMKAGKYFEAQQYGVATRAGAERIIHLCRLAMDTDTTNSDIVLCKVDLSNAFNNVSRDAFISLTREHFPELSRWVEWCYVETSSLTYGHRFVPSAEGVQQGDPLGPLLFSLVMLEVTKQIQSYTELLLNLWYLDDGVFIGKAEEVRKALDILDHLGPGQGLHLNSKKCEIITLPSSAHQTSLFPDIPKDKQNTEGNFDILGSPIGSHKHCAEYLMTNAIEPAEDTLVASSLIEDPQVAMALIRQCAGFCQLVYALRTTPPQCIQRVCEHLDNSLLSTAEEILCPLNAPARAQIQRLKRHGGFGLRSSEMYSSSAYVASVVFAASKDGWNPLDAEVFSPAVNDVNAKAGGTLVDPETGRFLCPTTQQRDRSHPSFPPKPPIHSSTQVDTAREPSDTGPFLDADPPLGADLDIDIDPPEWDESIIPRQKDIIRAIGEREFNIAYCSADTRTRTRWVSQSGKGASSWAFVTPSKDLGYAFKPAEFRTLCRWWLGVDVYGETRPCPSDECKLPLGPEGDHALVCKHGQGIINRHNSLVEHFSSFCGHASLAPQREHSLGNRGPGGGLTRPGDVFLPTYSKAKGMVLDFAVTHAQQTKYTDKVRNASWVAAGSFAEHYAAEKRCTNGWRLRKQAMNSQPWW